jgi:alanine racemase
LMTHFATADDLHDGGFFDAQLDAFLDWAVPIKKSNPRVLLHAANSAAVFRDRRAHLDLSRCGIALYGIDPFHRDAGERGLKSALTLTSYVAAVKECQPGQSTGYGRRFVANEATTIATVPIGYADGLGRGLGNNWSAVVNGRRCPVVGNVSMDSITLQVPDGAAVSIGDEVTLLGGLLTVESMAQALGTIGYEVTTRIGPRASRVGVNGNV